MRAVSLSLCLVALVFVADAPHRHAAASPSASWIAAIQGDLAHQEYFVSGESPQAPNRAQGIRTYFGAQGVRIVPRETNTPVWEGTLTLERFGGQAAPGARRSIRDNRVTYERGALSEWYVNDEHGLEQGFTLAAAPAGSPHLEFDVAVGGTVEPRLSRDGREICLVDTHGTPVLRLKSLHTRDARGRELASHFALADNGQEFAIEVDATCAAYPVTVDPLMTSPDWFKESNLAGAEIGVSVATAGDVNGDGYSDIIVGAANYDTGDPNGGQVTVYYGGPTGPSTTPSWSAKDVTTTGFGGTVATAGDVNGDGYADILVGAPVANSGAGEVYCWYGSSSGLGANGTTANADWKVAGPQTGDQLGVSIACAGDIDNDGYSDVILGAPNRDAGGGVHPGKALIYKGGPGGLSTTLFKEIDGTGDAHLGVSVATAGDVNADLNSDVVIGASTATGTAATSGLAYVYYGPSLTTRVTLDPGVANALFGYSVCTAGDVDGDGYSDVIVGSPGYDLPTTDAGAVYVFKGAALGISSTYSWRYIGNSTGTKLGQSVCTAGDINGDGYADVIAGWLTYTNGQTSEGAALAWFGSATGLRASGAATATADWLYESNLAGARMGGSVATAGDVNGDGFSDVIAGAQLYSNGQTNEGAVALFFGHPGGAVIPQLQLNNNTAGAEYGWAVASGDFNNDGYSDVAIGAPDYDNGLADEGHVFVYQGSPGGLATTTTWQMAGDVYKQFVGISLANAGDVNGDGYDDLLVGADGNTDSGANNAGTAFAFYGSASGLVGGPLAIPSTASWTAQGILANGQFANSVSGAGDVNGDGFADVIIGEAFYANGQPNEGAAFVYMGSATGLPPNATAATANWTAESNLANAQFGASVASAGDVNGDGYDDIIVGAPQYTNTLTAEGAAFVWFGGPTGLGPNGTPANAGWSHFGGAASADFGRSVNRAGDMNGDGFGDIIVGAPKVGATGGGAIYLYRGSSTGPQLMASYGSGFTNAHMGQTVAPAGDLDGDGYDDTVAGMPGYANPDTLEGAVAVTYGAKVGTATVYLQSNVKRAQMGVPATAGDVNGDGFADLIVGIPAMNSFMGSAWLYYGGGQKGNRLLLPRQRNRFNGHFLTHMDRADSYQDIDVVHYAFSPFGRSLVHPQYEVVPQGRPFDAVTTTQPPALNLVANPDSLRTQVLTNINPGSVDHWRFRFKYDKARQPFMPASRWYQMPANGVDDVRMLPASFVSAKPVVASGVMLEGPMPNPFVSSTTLRFSLPYAMPVRIAIYDARGRLVRELMHASSEPAGWHSAAWNGEDAGGRRAASGTYFARLETAKSSTTRQVVLER